MNLQGVIFDLDGTLGNTVFVSVEAIVRAIYQHTGQTFSHPEIIARFGPSEPGIIKKIVPGEVWEDACHTFFEEYNRIHQNHKIGAYPGIRPILDMLSAHGIRQAIVTGKGERSAHISLDYFQLNGHFEHIETGWLTGSSKKAGIKTVLAAWQIPAENVVYLGDAPSDVTIARSVGVHPLSAAWADTADPEELLAEHPEALFETVAEFENWLKRQL